MSNGFNFDASQILGNLSAQPARFKASMSAYASSSAIKLQNYARQINHGKTIHTMLEIDLIQHGNGKEIR